ncbi:YkvA family protein [Thermincola potens]|uniref:DUF1232 domain-containing protein n=1 Tax=Thermincola potens (strain JR) TaxID=635013 RepID=D5XEV3_THEPJ|nr:YkvA family protein [Thermincola potens]ADG82174.1 protein of unknown function DUF1232 [Thermincola potens JR]
MPWLDSSVTRRLKILLNIPKSAPLVWHLIWDKRVEWWKKALFVGGPLVYFFLPVDFINDFVPFFGQLDDLTVLFLMLERFMASVPDYIIREYWQK